MGNIRSLGILGVRLSFTDLLRGLLFAAVLAGLPSFSGRAAGQSLLPGVPRVRPLGRIIFWFRSDQPIDAFLSRPVRGVTAVQIAGSWPALPEHVRKAHSLGMAVLGGVSGVAGLYQKTYRQSLDYYKHKVIDAQIAAGVDALYVDEPYGPALNDPRECGPGCWEPHAFSDRGVDWIVKTYNDLRDYFVAGRPGGQFGICFSSVAFHQKTLARGLKADFVCMETYGASNYHHLDQIKREFPGVKSMLLVYGAWPLCVNWRNSIKEGKTGAIDMWGFWNLDNYLRWVTGGGKALGENQLDPDWLEHASEFAQGNMSFCSTILTRSRLDPYNRVSHW